MGGLPDGEAFNQIQVSSRDGVGLPLQQVGDGKQMISDGELQR